MKRAGIFLCGVMAAVLMTGCGSVMPDLTEEETEIISDYAAGVLLKYDRVSSGRLMSMSEFEQAEAKKEEKKAAESAKEPEAEEEEAPEESRTDDTEVIDVSQDGESVSVPSSIEEYYGIQDIAFQYTGYELVQSYPQSADGEAAFFAMDATEGMQLLVIKFTASNTSAADQTLDMLGCGARFKVSVNGGSQENVLSTMLLNDMHMYKDVLPAGSEVELVSIVEIPQSVTVESLDFILCGDAGNSVMNLQ